MHSTSNEISNCNAYIVFRYMYGIFNYQSHPSICSMRKPISISERRSNLRTFPSIYQPSLLRAYLLILSITLARQPVSENPDLSDSILCIISWQKKGARNVLFGTENEKKQADGDGERVMIQSGLRRWIGWRLLNRFGYEGDAESAPQRAFLEVGRIFLLLLEYGDEKRDSGYRERAKK